jgi:protease-4
MGLIDQIGDLEESIIEAAKLAGIKEGYGQKYFDKELTPSERFTIGFLSGLNHFGFDLSFLRGRHSPLDNVIGLFESISSSFLQFNDPKGIYAHCFCSLVL